MKTLILVRHDHALSAFVAQVTSDALRPLSDEGRQKAAATAAKLADLSLHPAVILTSPLLRAKQTSQFIAEKLHTPVEEVKWLNGFFSDEEVAIALRERLAKTDTIIAVGHNPNITCVHNLLCGQIRPFSPGSFAVLEMDNSGNFKQISAGE
jgi:phosphohistidine phosphatase